MTMDSTRKRWIDHAQGMLEFALVLPLLLALSLGIIEAGRLLFIYSAVNTASREAARYGSASGDVGGLVEHYRDCVGIRAAAKRVGIIAGIDDANIAITYDHGPGTGAAFSSCPLPSNQEVALGDRIVVQVSATYKPVVPLVNFSSFPISSVTRRTVVKNIVVEGTPPPLYPPTIAFTTDSQSHDEADGAIIIDIQMSVATSKYVTLPFSVSGTALQGGGLDYTITPSPLVLIPGKTMAEILVQINDDNIDEPDETITVTLGTPTNANLASPDTHTVTILDNDDPPIVSFSLSDQSNSEDLAQLVTLQLSNPSSWDLTVPFTVSGTAQGGGVDYTITSSPIIVPALDTTANIVINVVDDLLDEYDETVVVTLEDPIINGTKGSPDVHTATILDNDDPPSAFFTWQDQSAEEADGSMVVEIQLTAISTKDITVPFTVSGTADPSEDYSIDPGPFFIPAGDISDSITITILDDGDPTEDDETVDVTMGTPTNAFKGSPSVHTATIVNTYVKPTVAFTSSSITVDENAGIFTIEAAISHASPVDVVVPFSVGGSATRGGGNDYTMTGSPLTIPAGSATGKITVTVNDDSLDEFDETIVVTMGNPVAATKGSPSVFTATILDNDAAPSVVLTSTGTTQPESVGSVTVSVQLSAVSSKTITVPFILTGDATQGAGMDFTITASPLTIAPGATTADILINVNDDSVIELSEQVIVTLGAPTNAIKSTPDVYRLTITDNEPVCPTPTGPPVIGSGADKNKLIWNLQSPSAIVPVNLNQVSIQWPSGTGAYLSAITFGNTVYAGSAPPPAFYLNSATPLWTGAFNTRQMIFVFDRNLKSVAGESYTVTATFGSCTPISATIPSE